MPLSLKSPVFDNGQNIPTRYTCDGEDINPTLEISDVPPSAKSLVLIVDDPDATRGATWDHWLLWNIPPDAVEISENSAPEGAVQGTTDFQEQKYGGPCPPVASPPHRYMFKLYALDTMLDLASGAAKNELEQAMKGHILDQTTLMGLYSR